MTGLRFRQSQAFEAAARANYARAPLAELPPDQFNVKGGLLFANVRRTVAKLYSVPKSNFMPRLGLAFKMNDKTVLQNGVRNLLWIPWSAAW